MIDEWGFEIHDPLGGIDYGPCRDFAPDTLGDAEQVEVCTTCFYHKLDHKLNEEDNS